MKRQRQSTRRYVVAPGVSADLCGYCMLATIDAERDLTVAEHAEWNVEWRLGDEERAEGRVATTRRLHLSHVRYQQIHPHPEGR